MARRVRGVTAAALAAAALAVAAVAVALASAAAGAGAQAPVVLDPHGVSVAAYGGWAAWSRADPATGMFALVLRSPQGAISLPAVPERTAPFDVELGPTRGREVGAVYSRCADAAAVVGCRLALLELGAAQPRERTLFPPGGGSEHEPAIWRGALVFLRRVPSSGAHRADAIYAWKIGSKAVAALTLPRSRGNRAAGWPAGLTGRITGLSFNGAQVGYVSSNVVGTFGETTLWFEPLGAPPELIDQHTGGAGNVCRPEFLSPVLSGRWLYAYLHACDPSANPRLDRLTRYRHGEVQVARYTFLHSGDEAISSAVVDGNGVDWAAEGAQRLPSVSWRTIAAPVQETFCSRSDLFC